MSSSIFTAFMTRLQEFATDQSLTVAWPGLHKSPPNTGMWLEAGFFPNEPRDLTWDNDAQVEKIGFFQVAVYWRPGINDGQNSEFDAVQVAEALTNYFRKGRSLGDVRVRKAAWLSPSVDEEGKSFIPVTVPYRGLVVVTGAGDYLLLETGDRLVLEDGTGSLVLEG